MMVNISISCGELIDKITILEIKSRRIKDTTNRKRIRKELAGLNNEYNKIKEQNPKAFIKVKILKNNLLALNKELWEIEDKIRKLEKDNDFGKKFIALARSVYLTNDKRFKIKNEINVLLKSGIIEIKHYQSYK